ncbi:hypothetical protein HFP57_14640 [Parasphingopyxis algicola]|uniref:hypothetical protein n=1 Tax=Parasphingopyxis algicola TaxID=2026624 RepID=UPI00159FDEAB|nr:hypothetical protein [Parasphingopyxis algicola]QLC26138.1 hypothetical protein HFP57_14640 [Parasphingopyxis algicola]
MGGLFINRIGGLIAGLALFAAPAAAERFSFVALGDTAYNLPDDLPRYDRLIRRINAAEPVFTIHVGDIWGARPCTEDSYRDALGWFSRYDHPVVYTPGDNEWTDCRRIEILRAFAGIGSEEDQRELADAYRFENAFANTSYVDVLAALSTLRSVFFAEPRSLGTDPMPLARQSDSGSDFPEMVENARWERDGVVFATVHVAGSDNDFRINDEARFQAAANRNRANIAWIRETFERAEAEDAPAVVIALHAGMFVDGEGGDLTGSAIRGGQAGPYGWIVFAIRDYAARFGKPVLLINGDFHEFVIDRPFMIDRGEGEAPLYENITRLQVYGAPQIRAVRVTVDTETPWVFGFEPLYAE